MIDLLNQTWLLIAGVGASIFNLCAALLTWVYSVLLILHHDMPRIEGLLIGILFAWLYTHREKNAWIRALAAPLKIIIDTLDIIWDETLEAITDITGDIKEKLSGTLSAGRNKLSAGVAYLTERLIALKIWVSSKFEKEEKEKEKAE